MVLLLENYLIILKERCCCAGEYMKKAYINILNKKMIFNRSIKTLKSVENCIYFAKRAFTTDG